jgi:hypothetical protein
MKKLKNKPCTPPLSSLSSQMTEKDILHESANFWVCKRGNKYEINLHGSTCSYKVGDKDSLEAAKSFIEKAEKYPENFKKMFGVK